MKTRVTRPRPFEAEAPDRNMPDAGPLMRAWAARRTALAPILSTAALALALAGVEGCARRASAESAQDERQAIVSTLGADDGYIFVINPFNCMLRQPQIDAMNALAQRHRRGGKVLMAGFDAVDSIAGVEALRDMGITLPASPLETSPLAKSGTFKSMGWPVSFALRDGNVISVLGGGEAERFGSWIAWLEHAPLPRIGAHHGPTPGDSL
jgi:hypothetical protein